MRANNLVTATTATSHGLIPGYQAQITNVPALAIGTGIASIAVNNENQAGIATITTNGAHGLAPNSYVNITGVPDQAIGASVTAWNLAVNAVGQGLLSMTTASAHGLQVGMMANVSLAGGTMQEMSVNSVPTSTTVTFITIAGTTGSGTTNATLTLPFPLPPAYSGNPTGATVQVLSCPTPTSFQIGFNFQDATWTGGGALSLPWDGTFYVVSVLSPTSFTYQQYGPDALITSAGTVTPWGQISPGLHQCRQFFITRQGQITKPSPPVQFMANGGQYVSVSNMLTGPANIVARGFEFTGAQGSYFFYIPVPAEVNGQIVSTATAINDNTTTSAVFDFGDSTLYSSQATSTPANDIASQVVLDGALGFADFKQRLVSFGQRNTVNNFLNMGFEGGPAGPSPAGWTIVSSGGAVVAGRTPGAWQVTIPSSGSWGEISQSAYQDAYGAPIAQPNTLYKIRLWLQPSVVSNFGPSFTALLSSASAGFSVDAEISNSQMNESGSYAEATFAAVMPSAIPNDLLLSLAANWGGAASALTWDEVEIIDAQSPYLDTELFASYPDNPEAFSGVTGLFGPPDDTHKVMDFAIIRNAPYILTQDPEGRLHQVKAGDTEPSGWDVQEVDSSCGALSAFCLTKSQSDNRSSSGGEEWFAWASMSGPRIFGGSIAHKIGQEIQPAWFDETNKSWPQINMAAALTAWALNDPTTRTLYFGLPLSAATAPNIVYPMNYRELDSAEDIASHPPFHPSFSGRLIATDNTRKWTRWNMKTNGAALMCRELGVLSTVLYGNAYTLNPAKYTDDDYGQIFPYYVTSALPDTAQEQMLQLDSGRKLLAYLSSMISSVGQVAITPLCDNLSNPWPFSVARTPGMSPDFELEWGGGSAIAHRMFFKIASNPNAPISLPIVSVSVSHDGVDGLVIYTSAPWSAALAQSLYRAPVSFSGLTNATWLNGQTLEVDAAFNWIVQSVSVGTFLFMLTVPAGMPPTYGTGSFGTSDTGTVIFTQTDNSFVLRKLTAWFKKAKIMVRGAAQ